MNSIGMKASRTMIGPLVPTACPMYPMVAARLYPGAVEATPMTMLDIRPIAPSLRPLSRGDRATVEGGAEVVIDAILEFAADSGGGCGRIPRICVYRRFRAILQGFPSQ